MDLTINEEGKHLFRFHLVIAGRITSQLLDRETVVDDMGTIDDGVLHKHLDTITHELLIDIPHDRIVVHRHTGILGVIDQRVADGLHIGTISPDVMVGINLAIHRVCLDIKGLYLQGISMHKEGIAL